MRFGVVVGRYHKDIAEAMLADAQAKAKELKVTLDPVVWVPGSYEVPLAAQELLERKDVDGIVVLGLIERGETLHGEQMGSVVSRLLKELELRHRKPVGMGIIGPGAVKAQARRRVGYAGAAVAAAAEAAELLRKLQRG
ncbi:MAG TPA: 6,7-dimethyl-8-ribityllumazine synthase [archaeon]|nr:6,7-dimethyl-8-ribityllumazine synthase [archaeon]